MIKAIRRRDYIMNSSVPIVWIQQLILNKVISSVHFSFFNVGKSLTLFHQYFTMYL